MRTRKAAIAKVRKIHEPMLTWLDSVHNPFAGIDEDEVRDVEPGSAEEILSREVVCMACVGYKPWPCDTARAVYSEDEVRRGLIAGRWPA